MFAPTAPSSLIGEPPWAQQSCKATSKGEVTPSLTPSSTSYPLCALPPLFASKGLPVFVGMEITVKGLVLKKPAATPPIPYPNPPGPPVIPPPDNEEYNSPPPIRSSWFTCKPTGMPPVGNTSDNIR